MQEDERCKMQEDERDLVEVLIFDEIEETVGTWLRTIIQRLERERTAIRRDLDKQPTPSRERLRGTPLYQEQHPKCGNPACATAFHWTGGGKFFRFRPAPVAIGESNSATDSPHGIHGVKHYWLCERCSHSFILGYEEGYGVMLNPIWPELPVSEAFKKFSVT
jgi:hypothetical protein